MRTRKFIEMTQQDSDKYELMAILRGYEWLIDNSLYIDKNKRFCSYMGSVIKLSNRLLDSLCILAEEPSKSHHIDRYSYDNERQIIRRINKAFQRAGFKKSIIMKIRGVEGYKINTSILPEAFIITK